MENQNWRGWLGLLVQETTRPRLNDVVFRWFAMLEDFVGQLFLSSRSPAGTPWAPLKRKRPKGHNPGMRPLIDTGALMSSVVGTGAGKIEVIEDDGGLFGTRVKYAGIHQDGGGNIPARPFLGTSPELEDMAAEMAADAIIDRLI